MFNFSDEREEALEQILKACETLGWEVSFLESDMAVNEDGEEGLDVDTITGMTIGTVEYLELCSPNMDDYND